MTAPRPAAAGSAHDRAARLRRLHVPGTPVVLPNAWDAASARAVEAAGFAGVATSSAAVSAVLGWEDGERAPVEEVLGATSRIARSVAVPVTVDFERGYELTPADIVVRLLAAGAAGVNLEDSDPVTGALIDTDDQAAFIADVRAAAGADLVINARTDAFLRRAGEPAEQLTASIERGNRYLEAGADCVYPLGAAGEEVIAELARRIDGPVNVAVPLASGLPIDRLAALGVARVTFGPQLQRAAYGQLAATVADLATAAGVSAPALTAGAGSPSR
jgi:2-methylisocitrate lyase-like PEP mutase family enzyme